MESQQLVTIIPWTFIAQILNLFIQAYLIKRFTEETEACGSEYRRGKESKGRCGSC